MSTKRILAAVSVSILALGLLVAVTPAARAAVPFAAIVSGGPLTEIDIGNELGCQVSHTGDAAFETYPPGTKPGDCGTFLAIGGTLYTPDFAAHGSTATGGLGAHSLFSPVGQSAVSGSGTTGDPYRVVTVVNAGPTVQITETDTYVAGQEAYRTDVQVRNNGGATLNAILYRAADCYLAGSDRGFGVIDPPSGSVACRENVNGSPGPRIEQWVPITGGNRYSENGYSTIWSQIGTKTAFPNTCRCSESLDNGAGLSWTLAIPAGQSLSRSHLTAFSPTGNLPLSMDKSADVPNSSPSTQNGYTVVVHNANTAPVTVNSVTDTLPAGFAYRPGTTTGDVTVDPVVNGQVLTWNGPFTAPASDELTFHFLVTVPSVNGTFFNEATADAGSFSVAGTGPAAQVIVGPGGCTIYGTIRSETINGTNGNDVICGLAGNDTLNGLRGNDTLLGGDGNDTLRAGDGNDVLRGGNGIDKLFGDGNTDQLFGDGGQDHLQGGLGNDTLNGGAGNDYLTNAQGNDRFTGGTGNDVFNDQFAFSAVAIDLGAGTAIGGMLGSDTLASIEWAFGGGYNDSMRGNAGANLLAGLGGYDRIYGLGGNDRVIGDQAGGIYEAGFDRDDALYGGAGNDEFSGGGGRDLCAQQGGHYTITPLSCEVYTA